MMDRDALTKKEILTIKWVKENYKSPFKLFDQKDLVPKQAFGSYLSAPFDETSAMVFRDDLIKRFARSSKCWRPAS